MNKLTTWHNKYVFIIFPLVIRRHCIVNNYEHPWIVIYIISFTPIQHVIQATMILYYLEMRPLPWELLSCECSTTLFKILLLFEPFVTYNCVFAGSLIKNILTYLLTYLLIWNNDWSAGSFVSRISFWVRYLRMKCFLFDV